MIEGSIPADPVYCANLGYSEFLYCCTFSGDGLTNQHCFDWSETDYTQCSSSDCIRDCQNSTLLYSLQTPSYYGGYGASVQSLYDTCVALPSLYGYIKQGLISSDVRSRISPSLTNATLAVIETVTDAVTQCLSDTCDQVLHSTVCETNCSTSSLRFNSTSPSMWNISNCLSTICQSIPSVGGVTNADVVGIGVYVSYVSQCALALLAWSALTLLEIAISRARSPLEPGLLHQKESIITAIVEFHKAQCFFSIPVMVATLCSGIFRSNLLNVYTLLPIALNSIAPLQLVFFMIVHYARFSRYLMLLTLVSWVLASIVYWVLYSQLTQPSPLEPLEGEYFLVEFTQSVTSTPTCGGSSALTICPNIIAWPSLVRAQFAFYYSPWVWSWYALCFTALLAVRGLDTLVNNSQLVNIWRKNRFLPESIRKQSQQIVNVGGNCLFWTGSLVCVGLVCMQLYFLSLDFDMALIHNGWGFGQIVAVTVWLPPIAEYVQLQFSGVIAGSQYRFAKTLKVVRDADDTAKRDQKGQPAGSSQTISTTSTGANLKAASLHAVDALSDQSTSDDNDSNSSHAGSSETTSGAITVDQQQLEIRRRTTSQLEEGVVAGIPAGPGT
ncbi:hypothetical protein PV11_00580 [Exophiala sideris]|uniref:Uncharacterized protein n=1 Tax=Exophiala sideris TaxID=1016849 RepID=A0A0D1XAC9_9EURO|nr:hypothetical protein PV11_00580 [Exophiala sideris]